MSAQLEIVETALMETVKHVTREINLIARNFACLGVEAASQATAEHVRRFWAPLLKTALASAATAHPESFSPIAREAIRALAPRPPFRKIPNIGSERGRAVFGPKGNP
jgi:predicted  nucleic acid-binding Zn ribbon protein